MQNHLSKLGIIFGTASEGIDLVPDATLPPTDAIETMEDTVDWLGSVMTIGKEYLFDKVIPVGFKICIAIVIFLIGKFLVKKLVKFLDKSLHRSNMEEATIHFLCSVASGMGIVVLVFIVADYLSFSTGPIVALLGSAGLAIGLALQGSLANFAGGVLILVMKPFRIGDYIKALGNEGVVTKIDMVYTTLMTGDNRKVVIPNGALSNTNIENVTNSSKRRVDIVIGVDYASDIEKVKNVLFKLINEYEGILKTEDIKVYVDSFDASAINMGIRVWANTEDYWNVKWGLQEQIKIVFDREEISIPFNRMDVKIINSAD